MKPVIAVSAIIGFVLSILYTHLKYIQMLVGDSMNDKLSIAMFGARDIMRGCHNKNKGTEESERLRNPKFIFSYPRNERLIFLNSRNAVQEEISTMRVG